MYQNWIVEKAEENLKDRFQFAIQIYKNLHKELGSVYDKAYSLFEKNEKKQVGNCSIMARRLSQLQVKEVTPKLEETLELLEDFFLNTYKGFYCTLCDATSQSFIDIQKRRMIYSEKFCRNIIYNSLHPLLYYNIYFSRYLNLVSKFMTSCNHKSEFEDIPVDLKYVFNTNADHHSMLTRCYKHKNEVDWFESCEPICSKFQPTDFNKFFTPRLKKFEELTTYISGLNAKWESQEEQAERKLKSH